MMTPTPFGTADCRSDDYRRALRAIVESSESTGHSPERTLGTLVTYTAARLCTEEEGQGFSEPELALVVSQNQPRLADIIAAALEKEYDIAAP